MPQAHPWVDVQDYVATALSPDSLDACLAQRLAYTLSSPFCTHSKSEVNGESSGNKAGGEGLGSGRGFPHGLCNAHLLDIPSLWCGRQPR